MTSRSYYILYDKNVPHVSTKGECIIADLNPFLLLCDS